MEKKERTRFLKTLLLMLATSVVTGVLACAVTLMYVGVRDTNPLPSQEKGNEAVPLPQLIDATVPVSQFNTVEVARKALPAVVGIQVLKVDRPSLFRGNEEELWGVGSGVIVSPDGYILTNNHVAGGKNRRMIISLADGRNVEGYTVWWDSVLDLAIVKVDLSNLPTVPLGDAEKLRVGEPAVAIGNPFGLQLQRTVTSGIISALNRTIQVESDEGINYMEDLIQTDASINPGNSGGPLLNSRGEVIGINTVKVASAEAIGFAIPINIAVPIINRLVRDGSFNEPYMGIFAYDREVIPYLGVNFKLDSGIYVAHVDEEGPAYRSGIKVGCIITRVDGIEVNSMMQLRTYIYTKEPGDTIEVTHIERETGKVVTVPIKLGAKTRDGLVTR